MTLLALCLLSHVVHFKLKVQTHSKKCLISWENILMMEGKFLRLSLTGYIMFIFIGCINLQRNSHIKSAQTANIWHKMFSLSSSGAVLWAAGHSWGLYKPGEGVPARHHLHCCAKTPPYTPLLCRPQWESESTLLAHITQPWFPLKAVQCVYVLVRILSFTLCSAR